MHREKKKHDNSPLVQSRELKNDIGHDKVNFKLKVKVITSDHGDGSADQFCE